jgi:hypothetical protein
MTVRSRSNNDAPIPVGWYERPIGGVHNFEGTTKVFYTHSTTDEINVSDNRQFNSAIWHMSETGGRMNGGNGAAPLGRWYHNFLCDIFRTSSFGHPAVSADKGNSFYATAAAARTSPSRPYVDVPVNILQLGEVAHLIRDRGLEITRSFNGGRRLHIPKGLNPYKEIGRENLRFQFGIAPLVGDLIKILDFQDQVERRIKEIERLMGPRGLRRTIKLGGLDDIEINTNIAPFTANSSGSTTVTLSGTRNTRRLVGGHVRWKPAYSVKHLSPGSMRMLARTAVLGETIDLSTLWEVMPWSWLIDWCFNIGTFLKTQRNIVPAVLSSITITRHTRTVYSYGGTTALSGAVTVSPMVIEIDTKDRAPASILPTAHFPFLSGNQMGILASLYVTRR